MIQNVPEQGGGQNRGGQLILYPVNYETSLFDSPSSARQLEFVSLSTHKITYTLLSPKPPKKPKQQHG